MSDPQAAVVSFNRALALYNRTLRRVGPAHRLIRALVWSGGDVIARALQAARGFELPSEPLLPLYKIELLVGAYERDTVRVCRRIVARGAVVMDVGAHAGYFSLIFATLVGQAGRVVAFEPHRGTYEVLCRNLGRRRVRNVEAINMAVADRAGEGILYETPLSMGHTLLRVKPYVDQARVATISLDTFLEARGIGDPDLVKIDVEGAEPEVLDGLKHLAGRSPTLCLIIEFKPSLLRARGYPPADLLTRLVAMDFDIAAIRRGGTLARIVPDTLDAFAASSGTCNVLARKIR